MDKYLVQFVGTLHWVMLGITGEAERGTQTDGHQETDPLTIPVCRQALGTRGLRSADSGLY